MSAGRLVRKKNVSQNSSARVCLSLSANFHRTDSCTCVVNLWMRGTRCFQHHLCVWFLSVETHLECLSYLSDGPCPCVSLSLAKSRKVSQRASRGHYACASESVFVARAFQGTRCTCRDSLLCMSNQRSVLNKKMNAKKLSGFPTK